MSIPGYLKPAITSITGRNPLLLLVSKSQQVAASSKGLDMWLLYCLPGFKNGDLISNRTLLLIFFCKVNTTAWLFL